MKYFLVRYTAHVGDYDHFVFCVLKAKNWRLAKDKASKHMYREGDWERNSCSCCGDGVPIHKLDEIDEITKVQADVLKPLERLELVFFIN